MCGIAGAVGVTSPDAVRVMTDALTHRGPDNSGVFFDANARVALGHRRLSIIDVSSCGHQPMSYAGGRYTILFNGEIYNPIAHTRRVRSLAVERGREDFDFPGTDRLLDLPLQRPDIMHLHNLHGGYFDLRLLPELSRRVPTILLVEPANAGAFAAAVARLLDDRSLRQSIAANGLRHGQQEYTLDLQAPCFLDWYAEILAA